MELKIFEEKEKVKQPVYLRLVEGYEGINLIVCDKYGYRTRGGNLLRFKDGIIILSRNVNKDLGFQVDSDGRIEVE